MNNYNYNETFDIFRIKFKNSIFKLNIYAKVLIIFILSFFNFWFNNYFFKGKDHFYFDEYETDVFNEIKNKLLNSECSLMVGNQREFLNGIIRKYKPTKLLELGVLKGGSSIIILNAIKDIKNSHLYSIDILDFKWVGSCVKNYFPHLKDKWTLFKGNIAAKYLEKIGKNIDLALIDTSHFEPGEILDFLMILPFLKNDAIIIFHDIDSQILSAKGKDMRNEWAPYIIFNIIRGEKFFPSGEGIFNKGIGAIKLENNQQRFIHDYCRALGGQWQYFPPEEHIQIVINFFEKYFDTECLNILKESVLFNRQFVKDNPKKDFYLEKRKLLKNKLNGKKNNNI